jgi:DNA-binding XRE family transcriptional regulator
LTFSGYQPSAKPITDISGRFCFLLFSIENRYADAGRTDTMTPKEIPHNLGPKLKAIRLHLGYTLEQMAEAVGKPGASRRTRVHEWEGGKRQPDLNCLLAYARLASVSTDVLIDDRFELNLKGEHR